MVQAISTAMTKSPTPPHTPAVSTVVPCYRRGDLLTECLASLREQEFLDWEAIVIDDGTPSTDKDAVADQGDEAQSASGSSSNTATVFLRKRIRYAPTNKRASLYPTWIEGQLWGQLTIASLLGPLVRRIRSRMAHDEDAISIPA